MDGSTWWDAHEAGEADGFHRGVRAAIAALYWRAGDLMRRSEEAIDAGNMELACNLARASSSAHAMAILLVVPRA